MPQLFDGLRRSRLDGMNPPPIEARKQGFELGVGQRHQSILDTGPGKGQHCRGSSRSGMKIQCQVIFS